MAVLKKLDGNRRIRLRDFDPSDTGGVTEDQAAARMPALSEQLEGLQEMMYAAGTHALLIVLQGMDTAGKDGTIRHVMNSFSPQGCDVASFRVPTALEAGHDFLWRIHQRTPVKGGVTIFNRSHYEDVLVVRVHGLVPKPVWKARYDRINAFEALVADSSTVILKFFLHISKDEQERRLIDREKDPSTYWKLSATDWKERAYWDDYQAAYADAINRCATRVAPWYVVPANHKWFRNYAVARTIVSTLKPLKQGWVRHLEQVGKAAEAEIRAVRGGSGA